MSPLFHLPPRASALTAVALASVAFACGPTFEARFHSVETGSERSAVVERLGAPDRAGWFAFDPAVMGPPEILHGVVSAGAEVEELTWTRTTARGDSVVFQVYAGRDGRVLATTNHGVGTIF